MRHDGLKVGRGGSFMLKMEEYEEGKGRVHTD